MRAYAAFAALQAVLFVLIAAGTPVPATAQSARPPAKSAPAATRPLWKDLTASQREALAPLAGEWDTIDEPRKRKWLEVAPRYHQLSPEGQQRMHARMKEFARLTPEQRWTARENFQRAYELPADQRNSLIQQYKDLPPERKQELNEKARAKPEPARRAQRDSRGEAKADAARPAAKERSKSATPPATN
jgi:hypothetical protein